MGKRSNYERLENDAYFTPYEAMIPLLPFLKPNTKFADFCAGNSCMQRHLEKHGHECTYQSDIDPKNKNIEQRDVLFFGGDLPDCETIITNPPWERELLHPMIDIFRKKAPTWLLFDSDWMFTKQARPYKPFCSLIVTVGRISWMGNGQSGMDNCCWYLFGNQKTPTIFV